MRTQLRNIGIIAHVDAGKTTTAERILYYTGKNHRMGDTHNGTTTLDYDAQEKAKGITINSAATTVFWRNHPINIIDTPGHIDFNIEVKRSLRVLDGAVVVFDGVAGVEPQTETNWRLADQYHVPRIALINKLDRLGADYLRVVKMLEERLEIIPLVLYLPIGTEGNFQGVVDLLKERALIWSNAEGVPYDEQTIPSAMKELVHTWRERLIEQVVEQDDDALQAWLEGLEPTVETLQRCIRKGTIVGAFVPVLAASMYRSYGVEPLLDAVVDYLPSPYEVANTVDADINAPLVALLFKVITSLHGQLSFLRIYRGKLHKGDTVLNAVTGKQERIALLYEMHANQRHEIKQAQAGDIIAVVGIKDALTGQTFTALDSPVILENITVPEPVIDIAIEPKKQADQQHLGLALQTLVREDPSLRVSQDVETGQVILSGMGELQLEVRLEDLRSRFNVEVITGQPRVAYCETIEQSVEMRYLHKKQSGGPGQYAEVKILVEPLLGTQDIVFENQVVGGAIPREYIPGVETGIRRAAKSGILGGFLCIGIKVILVDGSFHEQDSSVMAFEIAGAEVFKQAMAKANPVMLEPIMSVEVHTPLTTLGDCMGDLNRRRGLINSQTVQSQYGIIQANVPLREMFGYIAKLRALTSGRGSFNMQFSHYATAPNKTVE